MNLARSSDRLRGKRDVAVPSVADGSAIAGGVAWIAIAAVGRLTTIQEVLALAVLVIVPLGLRLADTPRRDGTRSLWYRLAVIGQPAGAVAAVAALWLPQTAVAVVLAVPWLLVTGSAATFGVWRFLQRGLSPLSELAIDAGLVYLPVASVALVLDRAGVSLFFAPVIITLTVAHFHYAGFALPLAAGVIGRLSAAGPWRRLLRATTAFVVLGPAVIAVGISFSPLVEVIAVTAFTLAVSLFDIAVLGGVLPSLTTWPRRLLVGVGVLALPGSMVAALLYGVGAFTGTTYVTIGEMVQTHGLVNAFGFALCTLVGLRLVAPTSAVRAPGIGFHRLPSRLRIGTTFFEREGLVADRPASGMMASLGAYARDGFDPDRVDKAVRTFFERTGAYELSVDPAWSRLGHVVAAIYAPIARRTGQLVFPTEAATGEAALTGRVVALDSEDAPDARAWVRSNEDRVDEPRRLTYAAAYRRYEDEVPLLEVTFPLPIGSLTGLLRVEHGEDGAVVLSSHPSPDDDAGLYFVVRGFGVSLPIRETIEVAPSTGQGPITAHHDVSLLGRWFFTLDYEMRDSAREDVAHSNRASTA